MLSLYYKDLYTYEERSIFYLDAWNNTTNEKDKEYFRKSYELWNGIYTKLLNLKWYQKLFYKRES